MTWQCKGIIYGRSGPTYQSNHSCWWFGSARGSYMEDQDLHISQTIAADTWQCKGIIHGRSGPTYQSNHSCWWLGSARGSYMEDQDLHISQTIAADDLAVQGDHIWKIRTYISVKPYLLMTWQCKGIIYGRSGLTYQSNHSCWWLGSARGSYMEDQDLHISQTIAADDLAVQGDHIWKIRTYISVKP